MNTISKAVIPAAGRGTRMQPISDYLPKPMLPLGKKPVLQHIVDELTAAGISEIAIIARSEDTAIFDFFSNDPCIKILEDNSASGPGGAILEARRFVANASFAVVFSDAPILGGNSSAHLKELMELKQNQEAAAVLSAYRVPENEITSRGIMIFEDEDKQDKFVTLKDIMEKPSEEETQSRWASTCRYVLGPPIFDVLEDLSRDKGGELQLTPAIAKLIRDGKRVLAKPLPNNLQRHDTGNFEGYFNALKEYLE